MIENKLSYNPFKMWGSWVGFVIGILIPIFWMLSIMGGLTHSLPESEAFIMTLTTFLKISIIFLYPIGYLSIPLSWIGFEPLTEIMLLTPIFYFLCGWGVHSLIRYFRGKQKNDKDWS